MQTRRDLYQAHRLMVQRVGLALIQGEPDVPESPMRRSTTAALSGAMVAVLIAAIAGVWGLIKHDGSNGLTNPGQIIIESGTGTKYIWQSNTQRMVPVANYASAVLAVNNSGGGKPNVVTASRTALQHYRRGPEIGIPGAPDSLPDKSHLVRAPWSVCVNNGTRTGNIAAEVTSLVAGQSVGGRLLPGDQAVMVQTPDGQDWLVWNNQRLKVLLAPGEVTSLISGLTPAKVTSSWVQALNEGTDFTDPQVPDRGKAVTLADNTSYKVGQVFVSGGEYYVLLDDGFAKISQTQAQLLLDDSATQAAYPGGQAIKAIEIDPARVSGKQSSKALLDERLPVTLPAIQRWDPSTPLCVVYAHTDQAQATAQLSIGGTVSAAEVATSGQSNQVDQVLMPPGKAAVIGILPGSGLQNDINSWVVVNDQGLKYQVSSKDVVTKLGYDIAKAAPVPSNIVSLIPSGGATLDLTEASCPITQNATCAKPEKQGS